ncbi:transmembrane protein 209-like [Tubulanus polymorphus]|uniref:transmembrane protein 209-like n=1 Tax=Tubulanus polymorphus TaxID=672921 RepID=UPI003DA27910
MVSHDSSLVRSSPVIEQAYKKKTQLKKSNKALWWAFLNFCLALFLYSQIFLGKFDGYFDISPNLIRYIIYGLAAVFTLNTVVDFGKYVYLSFSVTSTPVHLTPKQRQSLKINTGEPGFKTVHHMPSSTDSVRGSPFHSPGIIGSPTISAFSRSPSAALTPSPAHNISAPATSYSPVGSYQASHSHLSSPGASFSFQTPGQHNSPPTGRMSMLFRDGEEMSGLRSRIHTITPRSSPIGSSDEVISDLTTLDKVRQEQHNKDKAYNRTQMAILEASPNSGSSFWNYSRSLSDYSPILRVNQYQLACRSPQSILSNRDDDPDDPATYRGDETWAKLGIARDQLDHWVENIRKWLSQTIMIRLVEEINGINKELRRHGCDDMRIGEVSISTLKQLAITKGNQIPTLNLIIQFLDVSTNQEYLVARIKELGKGGCLTDYTWHGGMEFKGKQWAEHLPTDAAIVMHALCTYLDSRLPPHPKHPDGRTFSNHHFLKTPDKPNIQKKDNLILYQSKINPPHYKIIIGDDTWDLPKGRQNMFHAILLFFYHVITKDHGMLGRVNLGMSGINVQWIYGDLCTGNDSLT